MILPHALVVSQHYYIIPIHLDILHPSYKFVNLLLKHPEYIHSESEKVVKTLLDDKAQLYASNIRHRMCNRKKRKRGEVKR